MDYNLSSRVANAGVYKVHCDRTLCGNDGGPPRAYYSIGENLSQRGYSCFKIAVTTWINIVWICVIPHLIAALRAYKMHRRDPDSNEKRARYGWDEPRGACERFSPQLPCFFKTAWNSVFRQAGGPSVLQIFWGTWVLLNHKHCGLIASLSWVSTCSINQVTEKTEFGPSWMIFGVKRWSKMYRPELWDLVMYSMSFKGPKISLLDVSSSWGGAYRELYMHISRFWETQKHGGCKNLCGISSSITLRPNGSV